MEQKNISVEIFRDIDRPTVSIDAAEGGVDHLRRITRGIDIVRATRLIRIAKPEAATVTSDNIRWPRSFSADLNLIVTDRQIISADRQVGGVTHITPGLGTLKTAVIDITAHNQPELIAAHEGGHLLHAKHSGVKWDGVAHCQDVTCYMYPVPIVELVQQRVRQKGVGAWLERQGLRPARYEEVTQPVAGSFCDECAEEIDKKALFLRMAKAGQAIPSGWL